MIQTLVITYPAGIKAKETSFGRLPLHIACRSGASPEAVECLLAYHPDGSKEGDNLKRIPLHVSICVDIDIDIDIDVVVVVVVVVVVTLPTLAIFVSFC